MFSFSNKFELSPKIYTYFYLIETFKSRHAYNPKRGKSELNGTPIFRELYFSYQPFKIKLQPICRHTCPTTGYKINPPFAYFAPITECFLRVTHEKRNKFNKSRR